MVSSSDVWYLNENNLEQKSAVWKYIFIYIFYIYTIKKCEKIPFYERAYNCAESLKYPKLLYVWEISSF